MLARLVSISWPCDLPPSASQSARITGVSHRTWLFFPISNQNLAFPSNTNVGILCLQQKSLIFILYYICRYLKNSFMVINISKYQQLADSPQDLVIQCIHKEALRQPSSSQKIKPCYVTFANCHSVNTPTIANFKVAIFNNWFANFLKIQQSVFGNTDKTFTMGTRVNFSGSTSLP